MTEHSCDVVVVGAGLSGLTAARLLHEQDISVAVVEASGRVGGRALTLENPETGVASDQGASLCVPAQTTLWQLLKDVGMEVWQLAPAQSVYITEDGVWRFTPTSLPTWNPLMRLDHYNVFSTMDRLANQIPPEEPWEASSAQEWDSCTMKDFFNRTVWFKSVRRIADAFVRVLACAEPEDVSMLWFLWLVRQTGGGRWATLVNPAAAGAGQFRVRGGIQHVCKVMAEQLGDKVTLNCPINKVENMEDRVLVTSSTDSYKAKAVVLAVPPPCYSKMSLSPPLPESVHHITMGHVYRCTLYYRNNFWGNGVLLYADYADCPFVHGNDDTIPENKYPAFTGFITGRKAKEATQMTKEQRKEAFCKCLAKAFSSEEAFEPLDYVEKNWNEEEFIGGGFYGFCAPAVLTSNNICGRCDPAGRVFLAGMESATCGYGSMEGAVWAGKRAAQQVIEFVSQDTDSSHPADTLG